MLMWSTPSLTSFPDPLFPVVVAPICGLNRNVQRLNYVQTNGWYSIELLELELFDHLTACNKRMMFNWIVSDILKNVERFNFV